MTHTLLDSRRTASPLALIYNWFTEGFDTPDLKDRQGLLGDHAIEHPADGRTIEMRRRDAKADNAAGANVHHDHDPMAFE